MTSALYLLLLIMIPVPEPQFPLPEAQPEQIERATGVRIYLA
jgi:hypothetical protein